MNNSLQIGKYLHTFDEDGKVITSVEISTLPIYEKCALIMKKKKETDHANALYRSGLESERSR